MDLIKLPEADRVDLRIGSCLDILTTLPENHFHACVTSPPYYGLRDYGHDGQIGLEDTPDAYVAKMVEVFRAVRRVLRPDGTLWLNLGDSYNSPPVGRFNGGGFKDKSAETGGRDLSGVETSGRLNKLAASGLPPKNLLGIPWRVAFALQADGWYLRQDIIWNKPNPMPESVKDRCTKTHEYIFLLSKSEKYYFDHEVIKEPAATAPGPSWYERRAAGATRGNVAFNGNVGAGTQRGVHGAGVSHNLGAADGKRNKRSVWTVTTKPFAGAHFATYPVELIEPCILAGSPKDGHVLDPFGGSGTTGLAAADLGRHATLIELNPEYGDIIRARLEHRLKHGFDQTA